MHHACVKTRSQKFAVNLSVLKVRGKSENPFLIGLVIGLFLTVKTLGSTSTSAASHK